MEPSGDVTTRTRPPLSKVEYVLERLRADIASGAVTAGTALRQLELAKRYGVSATPVREALRLLEADGTVMYSQHRGVTVAEFDPLEVHDLYCLRSAAEGSTTELAVSRLTPDITERIVRAHDRLAATGGKGNAEELSELNRDFHFAIYEAVSPVVSSFISQLWATMPKKLTIWGVKEHAKVLLEEHRQILEAITNGDAQEAGRLMAQHVMTSESYRQSQKASAE